MVAHSMPRSDAERTTIEEFEMSYRNITSPVMRSIGRCLYDCDYGGTSWTTREEAEEIERQLRLAPGRTLLEVGAGAGWPGLYLAKRSGCSVVMLDLPLEGLRVALERARTDALADRCVVAQADGAKLPLKGAAFDAVSHSDVLCCLPDKLGVLSECRRAIRNDGRMAFTVIYLADTLSAKDRAEAIAAGPPFVEADMTYEEMLARTGWRLHERTDLTAALAQSMRRMIDAQQAHADELAKLRGDEEVKEGLSQARRKVPTVDRRLLLRALFVAEPA
jgi:ubiquinone/menaquinone biosynthesis C-methylase UbiE